MIRIGKRKFSWNSVKFRIGGIASEALTAIDFDEKIADELVYGARRDGTALGVTAGRYEPGLCTIKMLIDEWHGTGVKPGISQKLCAGAGTLALADVEFDMNLQFFEEVVSVGQGGVITIYFPTCRVVNPKNSEAVSTKGSEIDIGIRVIDPVVRNGIQLPSLIRSLNL